ncbi:hypothetical protein CAPN006_05310 [Capnocytophaga canimorsus]|uniref:M16 family metallopeptidase n=1 Tax=Capnocytophaga canimorsus TaxID=28188 RepID=UPI001AC46EE5|nr:pitrilysin family protein [Capnocytophaga canimorsus]GIM56137.1 hypothetical protein CAPN006_05310 [Capnocytophaga canimorsus]
MKKNIKFIITLLITCFTVVTMAQNNRSKMPKPGKTPAINLKTPAIHKLPNGITLLVVENHKLPWVRLSFVMDVAPFAEGDKAGISDLTSSMMGNGSKNISKDDFNEEVDFLGGSIHLSTGGGSASSLPKYFPRIVEMMADAALNPNFTQEELDKEKARLIQGIKSGENSADAIASRVQGVLIYGSQHPYGEYATEQTINSITLEDVNSFYKDHFSPANVYMVVSGDIKEEQAKELISKYFYNWMPSTAMQKTVSSPTDVQYTQINFVDMPNAVQSEIRVNNLVDLTLSNKDFFAVLIANHILGGDFGSYINMNLREKHAFTYGAGSSVGTNKWTKSNFKIQTKVRNAVTDSAVVEILKEVNRIREEYVTDKSLAQAKAQYLGKFIMATENPATMAQYAINIKTQNLPEDFYKNYIANINAVTKEDIKRVANKYFKTNNLRFTIVGKGSEVAPKLEALTHNGKAMPVFYFDKFGNRTEAPKNQVIPNDVTAQNVIEKYFNALGSPQAVNAVKTTATFGKAEVQGMTLDIAIKRSKQNKFNQTLSMMGNVVSKQVYNGNSGYAEVQGQRVSIEGKDLAVLQQESGIFPENHFKNHPEVKLVGVEKVGEEEAYNLQVSANKNVFYSISSGLKIKEVSTQEMNGQTIENTVFYKDYKEVNGVKFPFTISIAIMGQTLDFKVQEIKINSDVSDTDFE